MRRLFRRRRRPPHIVLHHLAAHGAVPHQQHRVDADALLLQQRALFTDRPRRSPILVHDHGGDALRHQVGRRPACAVRVAQPAVRARAVVGMRMDVDETGRHVLAGGVDGRRGPGIAQSSNRGDASVLHRDIRGEPRIAGAVEDAAVADEQIVGGRRLHRACRCDDGDGERGATKNGRGLHRRIVVLIHARGQPRRDSCVLRQPPWAG